MEMVYGIYDLPLSKVLLVRDPHHVRGVYLAESVLALQTACAQAWQDAPLVHEPAAFTDLFEALEAYLHGQPWTSLPVLLHGSAFQKEVWQALQKIPYGETRTYRQVAQSIDRPTAVRAVAHACAENRVALLIPCHRVVGQGGKLCGYRWGLDCKQKLLDWERRFKTPSPAPPLPKQPRSPPVSGVEGHGPD